MFIFSFMNLLNVKRSNIFLSNLILFLLPYHFIIMQLILTLEYLWTLKDLFFIRHRETLKILSSLMLFLSLSVCSIATRGTLSSSSILVGASIYSAVSISFSIFISASSTVFLMSKRTWLFRTPSRNPCTTTSYFIFMDTPGILHCKAL